MRKGRILVTGSFLLGIITILIVYFSLGLTGVIRTQVRDITIISESQSQLYDSTTTLTHHKILEVEGLYDGDYVVPTFTGSQLNAGTSNNTFSCVVYDANDFDVTDNYNINYVYGTLTVNPRTININVKSYEKVYDGLPLSINESHTITASNYNNYINDSISSLSGNGLVSSDVLTVNISGSAVDPATEVPLNINYTLTNNTGEDVSSNYTVSISKENNQAGEPSVSINQHLLTIKSKNYKKEYDNLPLSMDTYNGVAYEIEGRLYDGDILNVEFISELDSIGKMDNDFIYTITDTNGNDVSIKYNVTKELGELEIVPRKVYLSYNKSYEYTNSVVTPDFKDVEIDTFNLTQFISNYNITGDVLLETDAILPGSYLVDISNVQITNNENENITDCFDFITDKDINDNEIKNQLTINPIIIAVSPKADTTVIYNGTSHTLSLANYNYDESLLLDGHNLTESFIIKTENNTTIDEAINVGIYDFILGLQVFDQFGNDCTNYYNFSYVENRFQQTNARLIIQKASLDYSVISNGNNTKEYDGQEVDLSTIEFNILNANGLVNNDVIDINGSYLYYTREVLEIGTYDLLCNLKIINQNNIDVSNNYSCNLVGNNIRYTITKVSIQIENKTLNSVTYDGKDHVFTLDNFTIAGLDKIESNNHTCEMDVKEGSIEPDYCNVGTHTYTVTLIIYDNNGKNITSNYYNITSGEATLTIIPRDITVKSSSISQVYDGTEVSNAEYNVSSGTLAENQRIALRTYPGYIDAGTYKNEITIDILSSSQESVISNYNVKFDFGTITINKRAITITSDTLSKIYDGTELRSADYVINSGSILDEHEIVISNNPSIINASSCYNEVTVDITDADGISVIANYNVTLFYGTLTINKRPITITTATDSKEYDGKVLYNDTVTMNDSALVLNHTVNVTEFSTIVNVGTCVNIYEVNILSGRTSVLDNYEITWNYGTLTVTKRQITVETESASKPYDGYDLINRTLTVVSGSLAENQTSSTLEYASINTVGTCVNIIDVDILSGGQSVLENYDITWSYGTLTITKNILYIKTASASKEYDGLPLSNSTYQITTGNIADNQFITVTGSTAITEAITSVNQIKIDILLGQTSMLENYDIIWEYGTLTIHKKDIYIVTGSATKVSNGEPLSYPYCEVVGNGIVRDHRINITSAPSINEVGEIANILQIEILDSSDLNVINNYNITWDFGTLTILENPDMELDVITVRPSRISKIWDGNSYTGTTTLVFSGENIGNYTFDYNTSGIIIPTDTAIGVYNVTINSEMLNLRIYDASSEDVTSNFRINYENDYLVICRAQLEVSQASTIVTFNGSTYDLSIFDDVEIKYTWKDQIEGFDSTNYTIQIVPKNPTTTSITYPGRIQNDCFTVRVINNSTNRDVSTEFNIVYKYASLIVRKASLSIESCSYVLEEDETTYEYFNYTDDTGTYILTASELNQRIKDLYNLTMDIEFNFTASQSDAGESDNTFVIVNLEEVNELFSISTIFGKLTKN